MAGSEEAPCRFEKAPGELRVGETIGDAEARFPVVGLGPQAVLFEELLEEVNADKGAPGDSDREAGIILVQALGLDDPRDELKAPPLPSQSLSTKYFFSAF